MVSNCCFALDTVKLNNSKYPDSREMQYKYEVISHALTLTRDKYGEFAIVRESNIRSNHRALVGLISSLNINCYFAVTNPEWEKNAIAIKIPIRRGILNYRLLTVNKETQHRFDNIKSLDDLKKLRVGLRADWATTAIFKANGFNVVENHNFEGLFHMLSHDRIDYIPRGINEAHAEIINIAQNQQHIDNLTVQPNIALRLLSPYYLFVSPQKPRLAKRLSQGLEMMVADGSLKGLFDKFYSDKVTQANLAQRKIFTVNNAEIAETAPLQRKELWFEYDTSSPQATE